MITLVKSNTNHDHHHVHLFFNQIPNKQFQPNPSSMHSSFALDDLVIVIGGDFGARLFHSYFPSCDVWMELDPSGKNLKSLKQFDEDDVYCR